QEIDAWLDALPVRQRALALFLYASDLTRDQIADAVALPPAALAAAFGGVKTDLLNFFRMEWEAPPPPPIPPGPAIEYRETGVALAALLAPDAAATATARITGISSDLYAGWSLLATVTGLPADRSLALGGPILLEPDKPERRRMVAVALAEISDPHDETRRFLVKAFAID